MPAFHDDVFDDGLNELTNFADRLDVCSAEPTSFALAMSLSLGNKINLDVSAPADRAGGGREVTIAIFTDGEITDGGEATFWAITDTGGSRLLATGDITEIFGEPLEVTPGSTFKITAVHKIGFVVAP